jgi:hypothetical protein
LVKNFYFLNQPWVTSSIFSRISPAAFFFLSSNRAARPTPLLSAVSGSRWPSRNRTRMTTRGETVTRPRLSLQPGCPIVHWASSAANYRAYLMSEPTLCRTHETASTPPPEEWSPKQTFFPFFRIIMKWDSPLWFNLFKLCFELWLEIELRTYPCCARLGGESFINSRPPAPNFELSMPQTLAHRLARRRAATKPPKLNRPHTELQGIAPPLLDEETMTEDNWTTPPTPSKPRRSRLSLRA